MTKNVQEVNSGSILTPVAIDPTIISLERIAHQLSQKGAGIPINLIEYPLFHETSQIFVHKEYTGQFTKFDGPWMVAELTLIPPFLKGETLQQHNQSNLLFFVDPATAAVRLLELELSTGSTRVGKLALTGSVFVSKVSWESPAGASEPAGSVVLNVMVKI